MKKMNKIYEAPVAEMIEMQMPVVLMQSNLGGGTNASSGGVGGGTTNENPDTPAGSTTSSLGGF
jgi:hypothetical protein